MKNKLIQMLDSFAKFLIYLGFKVSPYKQKVVGFCTFRGPKPFLDLCESSMRELQAIDKGLYVGLTGNRNIIFYSFKTLYNIPPNIYTISEEFCAWSSHGIMTRLAYVFFRENLLTGKDRLSREERLRINLKAESKLYEWLALHNFPKPLVEFYKNKKSA